MGGFENPLQVESQERFGQPPTLKTKEAFEKAKCYLNLKVKGYFGRLNQEDFDQLLTFDFQEQLKENPPLEGVFSPEEELKKIKSLPREQRKEALGIFKEKLARQRKALAAMRVFIERTIEFNPDVPKEKLLGLVEKFGAEYGFDDRQRKISEQLINGYYENRQKALKIRQLFPDDYDLVYHLTGVNLRGERLKVSVGPMTIDIETTGFNAGRLYERSDKPTIVFRAGGFASQSVGENPVYFTVINKDWWVRIRLDDLSGGKTRRHEYEHQKNSLFRGIFENQKIPILWDYSEEEDPEIKKIILENFFKETRRAAFEAVKNEITAFLSSKTVPQLQRKLEGLFFKQEKSCYDYLADARNWEEFKDDPLYQETAQRMLVQEYREIIQKAVDAYAELVSRGKYSRQEATALLTDKPLEDWPKTIKRLLEQMK